MVVEKSVPSIPEEGLKITLEAGERVELTVADNSGSMEADQEFKSSGFLEVDSTLFNHNSSAMLPAAITEESDDEILELEGLTVFVDPFSAQYLEGVEIDYVTTMMGSGFTFRNPNASGGCGCGSSFTV